MIHDVDASLRELVRRDVVNGSDVEVVFDAPTSEWAARRNAPTLDVYLYDIREDMRWRAAGSVPERSDQGFVTGHHGLPRFFKLSYLVTAWTQRPEDEHRLLSAALACFLRADVIPPDVLQGQLEHQSLPVVCTVALPPPQDRSLSDVWSALGGELKPSLDVCVTAAFDTDRFVVAGPPVLEQPKLRFASGDASEPAPTKKRGRKAAKTTNTVPENTVPEDTVVGGEGDQPGRIVHVRGMERRR